MMTRRPLGLLAVAGMFAALGAGATAGSLGYHMSINDRLYTGTIGGGGPSSGVVQLGGSAINGRVNAIAFSSDGTLYASVNLNGGQHGLYSLSGVGSATPDATFVSSLASSTPSFDFVGTGAGERFIGVRAAAGSSVYYESQDSTFTTFTQVGNTGVNAAFPSSGYDSIADVYYGVRGGSNPSDRSIYTIDRTDGSAMDTGLDLTFDGSVNYGVINLSGGDVVDGAYYLSFFSRTLGLAVLGELDLTTGLFTELASFDPGIAVGEEISMGLALYVIPTPMGGAMAGAGLLLVGVRRRR